MNYDIHASDDGVTAAVERYLEVRNRLDRDGGDWGELADVLTDDAVYVDCAWGRTEGKDAIAEFLRTTMVGVDFVNPVDFWAADGPRVLVKWRQVLPGQEARWRALAAVGRDHPPLRRWRPASAMSRTCSNVVHCVEDIVDSRLAAGTRLQRPARTARPQPRSHAHLLDELAARFRDLCRPCTAGNSGRTWSSGGSCMARASRFWTSAHAFFDRGSMPIPSSTPSPSSTAQVWSTNVRRSTEGSIPIRSRASS